MSGNKRNIQLELWVIRFRRGDRSAFKEMVEGWERPLFYYIRRLVGNEEDAWDVLQDVWIKAARELAKLRDTRSVSAWLYKVARNTAISHLRKIRPCESLDDPESYREYPDESIELNIGQNDILDVHRAIESLPIVQRDAIVLHFLEDFSLDEISGITEIPLGTVKSRLHYAKLALKEFLTRESGQNDTEGERHA